MLTNSSPKVKATLLWVEKRQTRGGHWRRKGKGMEFPPFLTRRVPASINMKGRVGRQGKGRKKTSGGGNKAVRWGRPYLPLKKDEKRKVEVVSMRSRGKMGEKQLEHLPPGGGKVG